MHKMLILMISSVLIMTSILACKKPVEEDSNTAPKSYFPLKVGNSWEYSSTVKDTITAKILIDGRDYYEHLGLYFETSGVKAFYARNPCLVRVNNRNQLLVRVDDSEQVYFDFDAHVGQSWSYGMFTVSLESKEDSVRVPVGEFRNCYRFYFHTSRRSDSDWTYLVASEVGIVQFVTGKGGKYSLTRANLTTQERSR